MLKQGAGWWEAAVHKGMSAERTRILARHADRFLHGHGTAWPPALAWCHGGLDTLAQKTTHPIPTTPAPLAPLQLSRTSWAPFSVLMPHNHEPNGPCVEACCVHAMHFIFWNKNSMWDSIPAALPWNPVQIACRRAPQPPALAPSPLSSPFLSLSRPWRCHAVHPGMTAPWSAAVAPAPAPTCSLKSPCTRGGGGGGGGCVLDCSRTAGRTAPRQTPRTLDRGSSPGHVLGGGRAQLEHGEVLVLQGAPPS